MPTWNADQYLKFAGERTRPALDLAARVAIDSPPRVIDLGCGPGNSTAVVRQRWPRAEVVGLDNSPAMLAQARKDFPEHTWIESGIPDWRVSDGEKAFDVVFSNAALQWVPDHRREFPRLFAQVAPGGALAVQVPANLDSPAQRIMPELATSAPWRAHFSTQPKSWFVHPPEFYYDILAPHARRIDLWTTDYHHVLENLDGVIEWYRGTGLRPWLDALPDDATRTQFLGAYRARLVPYYPERADGRVLFPFRRLFIIAYR
jgi:trans-aconitate 2-methyltransferase